MLLMQHPVQPIRAKDGDMDEFYRQARKIARERRQSRPSLANQPSSDTDSKQLLWPFSTTLSRTPIRRRSSAKSDRRSSPPAPSCSNSPPLRLADLARQQVMATHVDNWREDMITVQQHLPMQHIIGSLKRDRDEMDKPSKRNNSVSQPEPLDTNLSPRIPSLSPSSINAHYHHTASTPASSSADSFLDLLRTPKSDATSPQPDTDRRFSYQSIEHIAKDIPQSALPGLNMALNLATITPDERDLFSEYAPRELDDPHLLMDEVVRMRDRMMVGKDVDPTEVAEQETGVQEQNDIDLQEQHELQQEMEIESTNNDVVIPVETTEDTVARHFDEFVNY